MWSLILNLYEHKHQSEQKWKVLAELATSKCEFQLAQECLHHAKDFGGLLLLATSAGNREMVERLGDVAQKEDQHNVAFLSNFVLGKLEDCLELLVKADRLPEAAFFARTYLPNQISRFEEFSLMPFIDSLVFLLIYLLNNHIRFHRYIYIPVIAVHDFTTQ